MANQSSFNRGKVQQADAIGVPSVAANHIPRHLTLFYRAQRFCRLPFPNVP